MEVKGKRAHVLAVSGPAQGHVRPLMKLMTQMANRGIKASFVNTEYIHAKVVAAMSEEDKRQSHIELMSIPDGLPPEDDRSDWLKLLESLARTMSRNLTDLIEKINCENKDERISHIIVDTTIGWILDIPKKMGAEPVAFQPSAAASMALKLHIPKLIEEGNLDINGFMMENELIKVSHDVPPWRRNELLWSIPSDLKGQKILFECILAAGKSVHQATWILCNTLYELESSAYEKPDGSAIYVSFGSIAVLSQDQLNELALALELSGRPFLWVVRSNLANGSPAEYPDGFRERVAERAKIVEWAPQERVLAHSSVWCFLSHCGWNSTMEGLSLGVPFLCWPYFADQFHNENYICDMWRIGLRLNRDENGLRSRHDIVSKIEMLYCDLHVKANALKLKEMAQGSVTESGSSFKNFESFISHLKK
ncbi:UDP-glycosyltransferase 83A1-like [Olea europaea subsp. europaea]|uniref:UDP-glycosyltransferase 83A1-like n=1 Tax=Olea europaea subsp. europaea TaxID=158383 RepID=A0A8S0URR9_OLEEU|nr:UDP-glycosyltransferase 83A1-like [Olea europaea subsp. europaea]